MNTLMNWLSFAAVVYIVGFKAKWWVGPIETTRHVMSSRHKNRSSDTDDTPIDPGTDDVVSSPDEDLDEDSDSETVEVAPGVFRSQDSRVRFIRRPVGPVPLEQLKGTGTGGSHGTTRPADPTPESNGLAQSVLERRRWVRARLDPDDALQLSPVEIDRRGAELFGCTPRTIQRDRDRITRLRNRPHRPK